MAKKKKIFDTQFRLNNVWQLITLFSMIFLYIGSKGMYIQHDDELKNISTMCLNEIETLNDELNSCIYSYNELLNASKDLLNEYELLEQGNKETS